MKYKVAKYSQSHCTLYLRSITKDQRDHHTGLRFIGVSKIEMPIFFDLIDTEINAQLISKDEFRFRLNSEPPVTIVAARCDWVKLHAYPKTLREVSELDV